MMKKGWTAIPVFLFLTACGGGGGGENDIADVNTGVAKGTVPDTGQTACYYDNLADGIYNPQEVSYCLDPGSAWSPDGQDGYYAINTMSFTDNGDGTVLDNITGVTWRKCTLGRSGNDCSVGTSGSYTWSDAQLECARLNLAGTGWRLPTALELTRIVDFGASSVTIDESIFPHTAYASYWSSTPHALMSEWAWYVSFVEGITWAMNKTETYYVRCVRG